MTIEVRQMTIKCNVRSKDDSERTGGVSSGCLEELKGEILAECRQLVQELVEAKRER